MRTLTLSCYGVNLRVVDEAETEICRPLLAALPPECGSCTDGDHIEATLTVAAAGGGVCRIVGGLEDRLAADEDEALLLCLMQEIDQIVSRMSRTLLFVHAAVVGWRGHAIVIPGRSFTGKSTLAAELVRRGAVYYSDEFAVLDEQGRVHAYRRTPVLRQRAVDAHGLRLHRVAESMDALPIGVIVSTTFQTSAVWRPSVVLGVRAVLPLIDNTVLAREEHERTLRFAARAAEGAVLLQGMRGEAAEVAARLLDVVDAVSASQALRWDAAPSTFAHDLALIATSRLATKSQPAPPPNRELRVAPHLVVADFLSRQEHERLLLFALDNEPGFKESGVISHKGGQGVDYGFRQSRTFSGAGFDAIWAVIEPRLRAMLPAVRRALGVAWFRAADIERQLTVHHGEGFFAPHTDDGNEQTARRRISCVYYFNATPRRFSGGSLKIYDWWLTPLGTTPAGTYTQIEPVDNSVVFFRSGDFHEVSPVRCEQQGFECGRFTIVMWYLESQPPPPATEPLTGPAPDAQPESASGSA